MANADLCLEVLNLLEAHPDVHNQRTWANGCVQGTTAPSTENLCGTTLCVAGAALLLQGELTFTEHKSGRHVWWTPMVRTRFMKAERPVEEYTNWMTRGAKHLGLTKVEADYLFLHTTNEEALEALRRGAKGERIIPRTNRPWYYRAYGDDDGQS